MASLAQQVHQVQLARQELQEQLVRLEREELRVPPGQLEQPG
ncbi:hypothetical protein [Paenibacillus sp. GCM10012306]